MPDLQFSVEEVAPTPNAATPQLDFRVRIANAIGGETIQSIALRAQVQIEPVRRRYTAEEQARLRELFGEPERWSNTLRPLLWTNTSVNLPGFSGQTRMDLAVPCTFDFNVAVTKYIYGLEDGDLPTAVLFSGTVFYSGRAGLQISQIPWDREARYRVPLSVWKQMMDLYYPDSAWICLRREAFDRLYEYRARHAIPNWEQTIERMLGRVAGVKS